MVYPKPTFFCNVAKERKINMTLKTIMSLHETKAFKYGVWSLIFYFPEHLLLSPASISSVPQRTKAYN
jgi:hypothetical protein